MNEQAESAGHAHCWHEVETASGARSRVVVCCWCGAVEDTTLGRETLTHGPYAPKRRLEFNESS